MKIAITRNVGLLLLSIWLIGTGLSAFVPALSRLGLVWPILAVVAGVMFLLGR